MKFQQVLFYQKKEKIEETKERICQFFGGIAVEIYYTVSHRYEETGELLFSIQLPTVSDEIRIDEDLWKRWAKALSKRFPEIEFSWEFHDKYAKMKDADETIAFLNGEETK